jgi:ubiquinone/menaquinone biosynthesis C-methylase UbiE
MGFYSKKIFPLIMEQTGKRPELAEYRRKTAGAARGKTLEIGFGTGLNLPFYQPGVKLVTVDSSEGMHKRARERVAKSNIPVENHVMSAETLPFADGTFDSIVSTLTLCSIPNIGRALDELRRVLRHDGKFYFWEHGLNPEPGVQKWQHRLNGLQKVVAVGCNLNRDIEGLLKAHDWEFTRLEKSAMPGASKLMYIYLGAATPRN